MSLLLPNELYVRIFNNLSIQNWNRLNFISREFNHLLHSINYKKQVTLRGSPVTEINFKLVDIELTDYYEDNLKSFFKLIDLKHLSLASSSFRLFEFNLIENLINLRSLVLFTCFISDDQFKSIEKLIKLELIYLRSCSITDNKFKSISRLIDLKSVCLIDDLLSEGIITDEGFRSIEKLVKLESLKLFNYPSITDEGFRSLEKLTRLKTLQIDYCDLITDDRLKNISKLIGLESLSLCNGNITQDGMISIDSLSHLKILTLCRFDISENGLILLEKRLVKLQSLQLIRCFKITDEESIEPILKINSSENSKCVIVCSKINLI